MPRLIHTVFALVFTTCTLQALDMPAVPEQLTLEQAKRLALTGNPGIEALLERVKAAEAVTGQARSAHYPQLNGTAAATWLDQVSLANGNDGDRPLYQTGITADWLLFDAFATRFRIKAAKAGSAVSLAQWQDGKRLLVEGVATVFLNCLLAQEASRITESDAEFNRELLDEASRRFAAGAGARVDVLNFSVRVRTAENALLGTQRTQRAARQTLAALLGLSSGNLPEATVLVPPELDPGKTIPDSGRAIADAIAYRPDLLQTKLTITQLDALIQANRRSYLPKLFAQGAFNLERVDTAHFNASRDADSYLGLALSWDIFDGHRRHYALAETKAQRRAAHAGHRQQINTITTEVRQAMDALETVEEQYENQSLITDMSREIRDIVRKEYGAGLAPLTRLNEVQTDLIRAEVELARTRILRAQAAETLAAATGTNTPD